MNVIVFQSNIEVYEWEYGLCAVTAAPQLRSAKFFDMDFILAKVYCQLLKITPQSIDTFS